MRTFKILLLLIVFCSCTDSGNSKERDQLQFAVAQFEEEKAQEAATEKFIQDYLQAITDQNWQERIMPFLVEGNETAAFMEQHTEFRKSFPNYTSEILRITVDGNEAIAWLEINTNYSKTYDYQKGFEVVRGIEATGQSVSWQEAWFFDVIEGKFGDKWAMLKDNYKILTDLEVEGVPTGFVQN